jgi:RNA polymerase sigma factor (sigma-70 family)
VIDVALLYVWHPELDCGNPSAAGIRTIGMVRMANRHDRLSDEALLAAVALAERDAVAVFIRRFQSRVYGLAVTIVNDRSLAEDVAAQTFERAWRHAASYDGRRGAVSTWLLTIARNLAIDALRVRRPEPMDPWVAAEMLPPADSDPARSAADADDIRRLRRALAALPEEQRRAVVLATIGGRTTAEIGVLEGIPTATAKTRLRTGLRRLRELTASGVGQ